MPTRDELHQLVSSLPDGALTAAHAMLAPLQTWPPPELLALEDEGRAFEQKVSERVERMRQRHPMGGGGGGSSFSLSPERRAQRCRGRPSARRPCR